jgi:glycosyltransferase involved in cell wall biosynthesis
MKVVFDANPLMGQKTGVGYLTFSLIKALAEKYPNDIELVGHYFNFLNKKDTSELPIACNIRYKKTTLFPTKALGVLRKLGIELPIELFCRENTDTYLYTNFVSLPSIKQRKQVLFIHDLSFFDVPQFVSSANGGFLKRYVPKSILRSSQIFTISNFSKKRIEQIYKPSIPVEIISVPSDVSNEADESIFSVHSIPNNFILFVGTLEPRKNLKTLLEAYKVIYEKTGISLVLAGGKGWKDEDLVNSINELQNLNLPIINTGYISDAQKTALFKSTTLYVQPSLYEGFGMPILESMSLGAPVLCSNLPVFREVAEDCASYFDPKSSEDLAKKAVEIITNKDLQKEMKKKSLARKNNYPTWSDVASQVFSKL